MVGDIFLIWCLKFFYKVLDNWKMAFKVLRIKFKIPKTIKYTNEPTGHLAIRLNDTKTKLFKTEEFFELIEYVHTSFGVKYITLICGALGLEREFDFEQSSKKISFFHNFEQIQTVSNSSISVNLIDNDSESLFLLKFKDVAIGKDASDYDSIYKYDVD